MTSVPCRYGDDITTVPDAPGDVTISRPSRDIHAAVVFLVIHIEHTHICAHVWQFYHKVSTQPIYKYYQILKVVNYYYFSTLGIKDPEGFGKQLEENCRNDHYSGQSSNTKESCSSTPLNRCTSTETRWNKKAVSRLSPE